MVKHSFCILAKCLNSHSHELVKSYIEFLLSIQYFCFGILYCIFMEIGRTPIALNPGFLFRILSRSFGIYIGHVPHPSLMSLKGNLLCTWFTQASNDQLWLHSGRFLVVYC